MSKKTDNILDIRRAAIDPRNLDTMPPLTFKGQRRDLPCLRCMRSALAGKSTGECHDSIGGQDRCFECCTDTRHKPRGVSCIPLEETERFRGLRQAWELFKQESSSCASSNTRIQTQASSTSRDTTCTMVNERVNQAPSALEQPKEVPRYRTTNRGEDITIYERVNPPSKTTKQPEETGTRRERIVYERRSTPATTKKTQESVKTAEEREELALSMVDEEAPDGALLRGRRESTCYARTRSSSPRSDGYDERRYRARSQDSQNDRDGVDVALLPSYSVPMLPLRSDSKLRELQEARGRRRSTPYARTGSSSTSSDIHDEIRSRTRSQDSKNDRGEVDMAMLSNPVGRAGIVKQKVERRERREVRGHRERTVYERTRSRSPRPLSVDSDDERRYRDRSPYPYNHRESTEDRSPSPFLKTWYCSNENRDIQEEREIWEAARKARERQEEINIDRQASREMDVDQVDPVVAARRSRIKKLLHDCTDFLVDFFVN